MRDRQNRDSRQMAGFESLEDRRLMSAEGAPVVVDSHFRFESSQELVFNFSEAMDANTIQPADSELQSQKKSALFPIVGVNLSADGRQARFHAAEILPDGDYSGYVAPGSMLGVGGAPLAQSDGVFLSFFVMAGDANQDRTVDIADFATLAGNFNGSATFSSGDFNYDGVADIGDFAILAGKFNQTLPDLPAVAPEAAAPQAASATRAESPSHSQGEKTEPAARIRLSDILVSSYQ